MHHCSLAFSRAWFRGGPGRLALESLTVHYLQSCICSRKCGICYQVTSEGLSSWNPTTCRQAASSCVRAEFGPRIVGRWSLILIWHSSIKLRNFFKDMQLPTNIVDCSNPAMEDRRSRLPLLDSVQIPSRSPGAVTPEWTTEYLIRVSTEARVYLGPPQAGSSLWFKTQLPQHQVAPHHFIPLSKFPS